MALAGEQAALLRQLIYEQKKKVIWRAALRGKDALPKEKLEKIERTFDLCELLVLAGQYHRALRFLCVNEKQIREMG